jgi:hypothetical protein
MFAKEKIEDAEFKCGAQAKKRKNMELGAYNELEKILLEWFQQMCPLFLFNYFLTIFVCIFLHSFVKLSTYLM